MMFLNGLVKVQYTVTYKGFGMTFAGVIWDGTVLFYSYGWYGNVHVVSEALNNSCPVWELRSYGDP